MARTIRTLLTLPSSPRWARRFYAKATSGRISGAVADAQGGVLPGATVTVTEVRTKLHPDRDDRRPGRLRVRQPAARHLQRAAEMQGFKKELKSGLRPRGRRPSHRRLPARGGRLTETVEVSVESETVNTVSGEIAPHGSTASRSRAWP